MRRSSILAALLALACAVPARAAILNFTDQFAGNTLPQSTPSMVTTTFTDIGRGNCAQTCYQVLMTVTTPGLTGNQHLDSLYFNVNPSNQFNSSLLSSNSLKFTWVSGPRAQVAGGSNSISFKTGNSPGGFPGVNGFYDLRLIYGSTRFAAGQTSVYVITGPAGFSSATFNTLASSTAAGGRGTPTTSGPFYAAAHVLSGSGSNTWISVTAPAPEPEVYATMLLGLALLPALTRRRKLTAKDRSKAA